MHAKVGICSMKTAFKVLILIFLGMIAASWIYLSLDHQPAQVISSPDRPAPPQEETSTITLLAAGDCLMHNTQIWSGQQPDGSYNFSSFFKEVRPIIEAADYSTSSFEAPMAGAASGYTGYPTFNSPDEAAQAFKEAGFDLVVTANNHILDRGYPGAIRTLEVMKNIGLETVGVYASTEDSQQFLIRDIKGIKVGYLGYTYGTNGIPVPADHPYLINFLDREKILTDIAALRPQVDVVVLFLHWGVEYSPRPTLEQQALARELFAAGADIILGSHPHVIQTMEIIPVNDRNCFVIYSMGNFISHQRGMERNSGIMLQMQLSKNMASGQTVLDKVEYIPTFSHSYHERGRMFFRVVPVEETIRKIEEGTEPYLGTKDLPLLQTVLEHTRSQLGDPFQN